MQNFNTVNSINSKIKKLVIFKCILLFRLNQCEVDNCYITNDKQYLPLVQDYDALLFHVWDMPRYKYKLPQGEISQKVSIL